MKRPLLVCRHPKFILKVSRAGYTLHHGVENVRLHFSEPNYEEEYRNLLLRCEVLDAEANQIEEQMNEISRKITVEKSQMKKIDMQEEKVHTQIQELKER
jgi:hypothetical protein